MVENKASSKTILSKKNFSLSYHERIHLQKDFNKVFKKGIRLENSSIKILAFKRNDGSNLKRLGLITSRKVGKAVLRNRTKRRIREIFRTNKCFLKNSLDLIFILKNQTAKLKFRDLKKSVLTLLKNAKLYFKANETL
ncbi:MAG: ribonuclease P protein component [Elusimicrobiota bacterium]|jgi:ribonuclease P protein component|nr:ribonuclease P protein component [Elusimicrobiota bacterium]